jgi:hypothetical protein
MFDSLDFAEQGAYEGKIWRRVVRMRIFTSTFWMVG